MYWAQSLEHLASDWLSWHVGLPFFLHLRVVLAASTHLYGLHLLALFGYKNACSFSQCSALHCQCTPAIHLHASCRPAQVHVCHGTVNAAPRSVVRCCTLRSLQERIAESSNIYFMQGLFCVCCTCNVRGAIRHSDGLVVFVRANDAIDSKHVRPVHACSHREACIHCSQKSCDLQRRACSSHVQSVLCLFTSASTGGWFTPAFLYH